MNWIIGGVAAIIVGYIISALTTLDALGNVVMAVGALVAVVGLVLMVAGGRNRPGGRRL